MSAGNDRKRTKQYAEWAKLAAALSCFDPTALVNVSKEGINTSDVASARRRGKIA